MRVRVRVGERVELGGELTHRGKAFLTTPHPTRHTPHATPSRPAPPLPTPRHAAAPAHLPQLPHATPRLVSMSHGLQRVGLALELGQGRGLGLELGPRLRLRLRVGRGLKGHRVGHELPARSVVVTD